MVRLPQVKMIRFDDYVKFYRNSVNSTEFMTQVFYRLTSESLIFDFQFMNYSYIVECEVSFEKILELYKDQQPESDGEVIITGKDDDPWISKFVIEYLNNRAVRDYGES